MVNKKHGGRTESGESIATSTPLQAGVTLPLGKSHSRKLSQQAIIITYFDEAGTLLQTQFIRTTRATRQMTILIRPKKSGSIAVQSVGKRLSNYKVTPVRRDEIKDPIGPGLHTQSWDAATTNMYYDILHAFSKLYWSNTSQATYNPFDGVSLPSFSGSSSAPPPQDPIAFDGVDPADFPDFNRCEFVYVAQNPQIVLPLRNNKSIVEHRFSTPDWNGSGISSVNAAKHAFFQALNYCAIGEVHTLEMANRHEVCQGQIQNGSEAEMVMDLKNNAMGIAIGKSSNCTTDDIWTLIQFAYQAGKLFKLDGSPTP